MSAFVQPLGNAAGVSDDKIPQPTAPAGRPAWNKPLLGPEAYEIIFGPLLGKRIGYVQGQFGNAGDALIHFATLRMFAAYGIEFVILNQNPWPIDRPIEISEKVDELVLYGGGNMGARSSQRLRETLRSCRLPITLLPQSWRAPEDAPYQRVFARERYSLSFCPSAMVAPDLGLAFEGRVDMEAEEPCGLLLRNDQEARFANIPSLGDPAAGLGRYDGNKYLQKASRFRKIITDRLHFAIAGLYLRREVVLLPNGYHKNRGVYEFSLVHLGCGWADSSEIALRISSDDL